MDPYDIMEEVLQDMGRTVFTGLAFLLFCILAGLLVQWLDVTAGFLWLLEFVL